MGEKNKSYVLGVDIGGTGMKGAIIDVRSGNLMSERFRIPTPHPAKPKPVAEVFGKIVKHFDWEGKIVGCGFPAIVKSGTAYSANNIHNKWIGTNIEKLFAKKTGCKVTVINDADAAGIGEVQYGAGKNFKGTLILITVGTGLGSALIIDGKLVPNTEFGSLFLHGKISEKYASSAVKLKEDLSWQEWAKRFNEYLQHIEYIFSPQLIIISGGMSKRMDKFSRYLKTDTKVIPAQRLNNAGIIGAAFYAYKTFK